MVMEYEIRLGDILDKLTPSEIHTIPGGRPATHSVYQN